MEPLHSSAAVGLCCRPPLTMETSMMLPMEPVEAGAHTPTLSQQFSHVFITQGSQHSSSLCYSMDRAALHLRRALLEGVTARMLTCSVCSIAP